ncbi:MAG: hypothetical protein KDK60_02485 [Chlamydiia bacterium]|nr:hypothetical protein [Chlamydiia bacterium]
MRIVILMMGLLLTFTGCYQVSSDEDADLRAVPVTNNPNVIPQREMGPMQSMPY